MLRGRRGLLVVLTRMNGLLTSLRDLLMCVGERAVIYATEP